jgi:hypothetical protein
MMMYDRDYFKAALSKANVSSRDIWTELDTTCQNFNKKSKSGNWSLSDIFEILKLTKMQFAEVFRTVEDRDREEKDKQVMEMINGTTWTCLHHTDNGYILAVPDTSKVPKQLKEKLQKLNVEIKESETEDFIL